MFTFLLHAHCFSACSLSCKWMLCLLFLNLFSLASWSLFFCVLLSFSSYSSSVFWFLSSLARPHSRVPVHLLPPPAQSHRYRDQEGTRAHASAQLKLCLGFAWCPPKRYIYLRLCLFISFFPLFTNWICWRSIKKQMQSKVPPVSVHSPVLGATQYGLYNTLAVFSSWIVS